MEPILDIQATVVGGDSRQIAVADALSRLFKKVKIYGHSQTTVPQSIECSFYLTEALAEAEVIILPIGGMNEEGLVWSYKGEPRIDFGKYLPSLLAESVIVTGSFTNKWLKIAESLKIKVLQYADDDEIAILNSIPTAEGTLQMAMEELPITIHDSSVVIVGFGRVAISVARVFKALGAKVTVVARRKASLARAIEMGCSTVLIDSLAEIVIGADLIVNTVPALIVDKQIITKLSAQTIIIDLASAPGGTDFEAAKEHNIKAILAPGLPGLVAPKTAGAILATTIPKLIAEFFQVGGGAQ